MRSVKIAGRSVLPDDTDQMFQLLGGGFAAGFFLYRFQNGQIKRLGEIEKPSWKVTRFRQLRSDRLDFP